jgi:hypothetical protein
MEITSKFPFCVPLAAESSAFSREIVYQGLTLLGLRPAAEAPRLR